MLPRPDQKTINTIKPATSLLSGASRRAFQAQTVIKHCNGNLRHAKTLFGWHRATLLRALHEKEIGQPVPDKKGRGRKSGTEHLPSLEADIRSLVDPNTQTHPTFENTFRYTRMIAQAVLEALVREKGWAGIAPNVYFLDKEYHIGAKLSKVEMKPYEQRLQRTPNIERWSLMIEPEKLDG